MNNFFSRTISDLFAEFVDHVRAAVSIGYLRPKTNEHTLQLADESQTRAMEMKSAVGELIAMQVLGGTIERETCVAWSLPQVADLNITQSMDVAGGFPW